MKKNTFKRSTRVARALSGLMGLAPSILVLSVSLASAACDTGFDDKKAAVVGEVEEALSAAKQEAEVASQAIASAAKDTAAAATGWALVPDKSEVAFVGAKVTGKHEGAFKEFSGNAQVSDQALTSFEVTIKMDSVESDDAKLTTHLKSADFFDVEKFPEATLKSTKIEAKPVDGASHQITGDLTLHGVSKSVTFPAQVSIVGSSAEGKAEFTINRKDFGIEYPGMKDDLIKDEVLLKLHAVFSAGTVRNAAEVVTEKSAAVAAGAEKGAEAAKSGAEGAAQQVKETASEAAQKVEQGGADLGKQAAEVAQKVGTAVDDATKAAAKETGSAADKAAAAAKQAAEAMEKAAEELKKANTK